MLRQCLFLTQKRLVYFQAILGSVSGNPRGRGLANHMSALAHTHRTVFTVCFGRFGSRWCTPPLCVAADTLSSLTHHHNNAVARAQVPRPRRSRGSVRARSSYPEPSNCDGLHGRRRGRADRRVAPRRRAGSARRTRHSGTALASRVVGRVPRDPAGERAGFGGDARRGGSRLAGGSRARHLRRRV